MEAGLKFFVKPIGIGRVVPMRFRRLSQRREIGCLDVKRGEVTAGKIRDSLLKTYLEPAFFRISGKPDSWKSPRNSFLPYFMDMPGVAYPD